MEISPGASKTKGNDKPRENKLATSGKKLTTNEATRHTLATVILELTAALQGARSTQLEAVFRSATHGATAARTAAVNVYKEFIPDHARLRTPLVNLLKKDVVWVWDDKCQKAFTNLKENLTTHPTLHLYQEDLPCQVYCNTSTFSITGVLKQVYPDGKTYTVQHFSRSLRSHERNYSDLELQCLAIVESVDNFRTCLNGRKFTIFSDHPALQWLKEIKAPSGRLFRWRLRLSRYEYEVRSINGVQQYETGVGTRIPFCGFLDAPLIQSQQSSPPRKSRVTIDHNKLRTVSRKGVLKTIVPSSLTTRLLKSVHTQHHHPNISKMTRLISSQYYWQNMTQDIAKQDVSNIRRSYKRQATRHFLSSRPYLSSRRAAGQSEDSTLSRSTNRKRSCDISRPIREKLSLGVKSKSKNGQLRFRSHRNNTYSCSVALAEFGQLLLRFQQGNKGSLFFYES
ncbi:K02A2.6-like [Cordylochernes scorpioides]|uniref:RNA-directed DNA polymerase n=1 Tax=Cordylochernes scorpioides TaxID=51811 RepID=A0ABY6LE43_9ARAC|nr:K02A2.6-like [Cordylochernes scorpioides]